MRNENMTAIQKAQPLSQTKTAATKSASSAESQKTKPASAPESAASLQGDKASLWKSHALLRNATLVGTPLAVFGTGEILGQALSKSTEKAVTSAIQKAMDAPALIKATLDNPKLIQTFPSLMGKGSTEVSALGFSKALHSAVVTKVNRSVAMTMDQAVATGSFVGSGNAVAQLEGQATQYTSQMSSNLGKYGKMFIDHLSLDKAEPYLQSSTGGWTTSVSISTDLNGGAAYFSKSSENVQRLAESANTAAWKLRQASPAAKLTIVSPDVAQNVAKATEETVLKSAQSKLSSAHRLLTHSHTGTALMGTLLGGLTAWDSYEALKTTQDAQSSTAGKVLAWTTVGLDAAALGSFIAKKPQLTLPAMGLAIGSSIAKQFVH